MVQAQVHGNLALYYLYLGNIGGASEHVPQAIKLFEAIDAHAALMTAWNLLAIVDDAQGDSAGATQTYERAYVLRWTWTERPMPHRMPPTSPSLSSREAMERRRGLEPEPQPIWTASRKATHPAVHRRNQARIAEDKETRKQ